MRGLETLPFFGSGVRQGAAERGPVGKGGGRGALTASKGGGHPGALRRADASPHTSATVGHALHAMLVLASELLGNGSFVHTHLPRPIGVATQRKSGAGQGPLRYRNYPVPQRTLL